MFSSCAKRLLLAVTASLLLLLAACGGEPTTPADEVRAALEAIEQAVQEGSIRRAAEVLDPQYKDPWHPTKATAVRSLLAYMHRHRDIHLFTLIKSLEVSTADNSAQATVYVAMTGVPAESLQTLVALQADLFRFDVQLARRAGGWRIVHSEWQRADLSAL